MLKMMKKMMFALVFALLALVGFACNQECPTPEECPTAPEGWINPEECPKCEECEECEECPTPEVCPTPEECPTPEVCPTPEECPSLPEGWIDPEECPTLPEGWIDPEECPTLPEGWIDPEECPTLPEGWIDPEECPEQDYIAPDGFELYDDMVIVGETKPLYYEEFTPEGAYEGLVWSSSNPDFVTVDQEGNVTGLRPGSAMITATSILAPEVSRSVEVVVVEDGIAPADIVNREKEYILSQLPIYAAADFEFPLPWNTDVEVIFELDGVAADKFVYPTDLAGDKAIDYKIKLTYDGVSTTADAKIWAVKDYNDNSYVRVETAKDAASAILGTFTNGEEKVSENISLPDYIYGVKMNWGTTLKSSLTADGEYNRPLDDKAVTLDITCEYGPYTSTKKFNVVVKGYSADEKIEYILNEGTLSQINGKKVNTSLVLPAYDSKFDVQLSYTSNNPEIYDNSGKLLKAVEAETEVSFTVKATYNISNVESFEKEFELKVVAAPANAAAVAAEKWLVEAGFDKEVHFPYGSEKGNVLNVPAKYVDGETEYEVTWDVEAVKLYSKGHEEEIQVFELTEEGQVELVAQYLRYTQVQLKGTFANGEESASVVLQLNVGVSDSAANIYSGTWRNTAQADGSLTLEQGLYDVVNNVSFFDAPLSYAADNYGGYMWSGYTIKVEQGGKVYEDFVMEYMTCYIREDANGNLYLDAANIYSGDGGNWGVFFVNTTNKDFVAEVGTYSASDQLFADGEPVSSSAGNRTGLTFDGYANGFVADATGKVIVSAGENKFQTAIKSTDVASFGSYSAPCVTIPANGYGMSWKYQFYGVGALAAITPFCQPGAQLTIKAYDVHPLSDYDATQAITNLEAAESTIALNNIANNASLENNLIKARNLYNALTGATKENALDLARLEAAEKAAAALIDAEIEALLGAESIDTVALGKLNTRLEKLTVEITSQLTKKADFTAKYDELAAIDLKVTLDYQGGYAVGLYKDTDKALVMDLFLADLYEYFIKVGAFQKEIVDGALVDNAALETPSFETFKSSDYWVTNYAKYQTTVLSEYLYEPAYVDGVANENYMGVKEGSVKFINQPEYNKWVDLLDYVDEATRYANGAGQDLWGRNGENYAELKWLPLQSYYNKGTMWKDQTAVLSTTTGTSLGAYRFAQYVAGVSINNNYKNYIPHNLYSATFDRQYTQENCSEIIYHCTDGTVELPLAAYKEGFEFLGWFFEDGSEAVITGATFADVTVYAKWLPKLQSSVEEVVGRELTGNYYGEGGKYNDFRGTTALGDLTIQSASVGLGTRAVVVGDNMFIMPKYALIELGKDATEAVSADKDMLRPYERDSYDNNSTGLVYDPATDTVKGQNSYGHGALYYNAGTQVVTISDVTLCYGRELGGTTYGYHKYQFVLDSATNTYSAKLIGATGSVELQPGEYLWCPMTADRFCSGLTDCDGTSGVKGVLSDGCAVEIVDTTDYIQIPEDLPWYTIKFVDGENNVASLYLDKGQAVAKPADLQKEGSEFLGWSTNPEATEAEEVVLTAEADLTYYAVWKKLDMFAETTVNPLADGTKSTEFATIAEALAKTLEGGTISVLAGTYTDELVIEKSVTILGPNASVAGYAARAEEAKFEGTMLISADNIVIKGLAFTGHDAKVTATIAGTDRSATVVTTSGKGFLFENNYVTSGKGIVFDFGTNEDVVFKNNFFDWTQENGASGAWAWRPIRLEVKTTNFTFESNKVIQTADDDTSAGLYDIVWMANAVGTVNILNNNLVGYSYNWNFNIANAKEATEINFIGNYVDGVVVDGVNSGNTTINVGPMGDNTVANFKDNVVTTAGTTYSYDVNDATTYAGTITVTGNKFYSATYKPRIKDELAASQVVHTGNYIKAGEVTATGSFAFTMDGNLTDEAAFDALSYEAATEEVKVTKFATGYQDGTQVYLAAKYQFNAWYDKEVALKYDVASESYTVIQADSNCTLAVGEYDLLLAVHGSCADTAGAAIVKAMQVGDKVVLSASYAELTGYAASTAVDVTVTIYSVKAAE